MKGTNLMDLKAANISNRANKKLDSNAEIRGWASRLMEHRVYILDNVETLSLKMNGIPDNFSTKK